MSVRRVALLTAGGFAPCLSSAVGGLIERYNEIDPTVEIIAYQNGYHGLLTGNYVLVDEEARKHAAVLHRFGGSPIGNSRVKLTNKKNLVERGLVSEDEDPLQKAAEQLRADGVDVLHTIGGDDTNTTAADLAAYLEEHDYHLTVVGLPKTIDNDVVPIRQSLGAWTAAEEVSEYSQNVIGEHRSNPRMLIIHEIMGRHCGWLTAAGSKCYHDWLKTQEWVPSIGLSQERWDIHAIFLPEMKIDLDAEAARLKAIMDEQGNVNIFLSEGAGVPEIIAEIEASRANADDLRLIKSMTDLAVECAFKGESGVIGHDEEDGDRLKAIPFPRIAGGKPFDISQPWFLEMMAEIGQTVEPAGE